MSIKIETKKNGKKKGKAQGFYLDDDLVELFENKVNKVNSDKTKVFNALVRAWVEEE